MKTKFHVQKRTFLPKLFSVNAMGKHRVEKTHWFERKILIPYHKYWAKQRNLQRPRPLQSKKAADFGQITEEQGARFRSDCFVLSWISATSSQGRVELVHSVFGDAENQVRSIFFLNQVIQEVKNFDWLYLFLATFNKKLIDNCLSRKGFWTEINFWVTITRSLQRITTESDQVVLSTRVCLWGLNLSKLVPI